MKDIAHIKLCLAYKGTRNYLHGTDMYEAVTSHLRQTMPQCASAKSKFIFHDFAKNQVDMIYVTGSEFLPRPDNARAEFLIENCASGWLIETDRAIDARRPYPEDAIVAGSSIEGRSISAPPASSFLPIEVLVSMTKRLHSELHPERSKWAFTRLEVLRMLTPVDATTFQVEMLHALGSRLTKSAIRTNNEQLGYIYFSAV